jgi:hypothetical protein
MVANWPVTRAHPTSGPGLPGAWPAGCGRSSLTPCRVEYLLERFSGDPLQSSLGFELLMLNFAVVLGLA